MLIIRLRRNDIPMTFKISNVTPISVFVAIVLNFISFGSRVVIDILSYFTPLDLNTFELRKTNIGCLFIIFLTLLWEIVPILSILFLFGRPIPSTGAKVQTQRKLAPSTRKQYYTKEYSHPLDVTSNIIGEYATGSINTTPGSLVFGSLPRYQHIFDNPRRYDSDDEAMRSLDDSSIHSRMERQDRNGFK